MSTTYPPSRHTSIGRLDGRSPVTIREVNPDDRAELRRLAQLDSAAVPSGRLLVGELDGEVRAAVALTGGEAIADPFHRTAELVDLLRARAEQVRDGRALRVIARSPSIAGRRLHRQAA